MKLHIKKLYKKPQTFQSTFGILFNAICNEQRNVTKNVLKGSNVINEINKVGYNGRTVSNKNAYEKRIAGNRKEKKTK